MFNNLQNNILCFTYRKPNIFPKFVYSLISFFEKNYRLEKKINHSFLISSESGIWLCNRKSKLKRIIPCWVFGMFLEKRRLYMAISSEHRSDIISMKFENNNLKNKPKLHYSQRTLYHNEKIHQLMVRDNIIFFANTCLNSITLLNKYDSRLINIFPFHDMTGYPISKDVNHINTVFPLIDGIVFVAHNGGNVGSIIGIIFNKTCKFYAYKNRGCHDIFVNEKELIFSDSFGMKKIDQKGLKKHSSIFYNKKNIHQESYFTRGIYLGENENLIGSSFHGKRDLRFTGKGEINITDKNFNTKEKYKLPFAQFHEIIGLEDSFNRKKLHDVPSNKIDLTLEKFLGKAFMEREFSIEENYKNPKVVRKNKLNYKNILKKIKK